MRLRPSSTFSFFFFNDTATTEIYTLSLHDALPICPLHTLHAIAQAFRIDVLRGVEATHPVIGLGVPQFHPALLDQSGTHAADAEPLGIQNVLQLHVHLSSRLRPPWRTHIAQATIQVLLRKQAKNPVALGYGVSWAVRA